MNGHTPSSTHPPLPPTTEEDRFAWLRLLRSRRVGPATFWRLMAEHGTARSALAALPEMAAAAGVTGYEICPEGVVAAEVRAARTLGARALFYGEPAYPALLAAMPDAPPMLWTMGRLDLLARPAVALVGARNASSLALRMARALAHDLSDAGHLVVSGLARGVDAAAHEGALAAGTLAVQAGGVDVIYPAENAGLAAAIAAKGLRVSEQPMGLEPQARHFPIRNRLIAGLAAATVVIEAAPKSGSLITAQLALGLGREVMAVPGHPMDPRAGGCLNLIRDGAILVRGAQDVLAALAPTPTRRRPAAPNAAPHRPAPRPLREAAALHRQILDRLGPSPVAEDQLIRDLALSAAQAGPLLADLELEGRIARSEGGMVALVA